MPLFDVAQLSCARAEANRSYFEFLRVPALSAGLYELPAGATDPQQPHTEDEIYYVVRGRGLIRVGYEDHAIQAGSVIFVPANVAHRFHQIDEDLTLLVVFAPAEGSPSR
jgi:quercetin dioxygenase-like cupin family protein